MNNKSIEFIFKLLEERGQSFKKSKYQKEKSRENFLNRLKSAKKNIHLLGLKFPNFITTSDHKIHKALKVLDDKGLDLDVYIYKPSLSVINEINKLNIYKEKYHTRDICKIDSYKDDFKNLNIHVIEYNNLIKMGLSSIDLGENNEFIHISQIKENEEIKNAEYYEFGGSLETKSFSELISKLLRNIK